MGNTRDMQQAIDTLEAVKSSIVNAYHAKSGLSRSRISTLMTNETWLDAREALKLGFCDEILFTAEEKPEEEEEKPDEDEPEKDDPDEDEDDDEKKGVHLYSTRLMDRMIMNRLGVADEEKPKPAEPPKEEETTVAELAQPVIGMDGTTEDGSVPYPILEKQLEFLR